MYITYITRYVEACLNKKDYTAGHFPQSFPMAQIGGLLATRSIGQFSTLYGGIEDLVVGLEAVLADGEVIRIRNVPSTAFVAAKFNPKYSVPGVMIFLAGGLLIFGLAANIQMLFIGKIIASAVCNGLASSLVIVKIRRVPEKRFTAINGIENFVQPVGQVIATLCMAQLLVIVGGWRNVHIICGVIMLVMVVVWFLSYKQGEADHTQAAYAASNLGFPMIGAIGNTSISSLRLFSLKARMEANKRKIIEIEPQHGFPREQSIAFRRMTGGNICHIIEGEGPGEKAAILCQGITKEGVVS